MRIVDAVDCLRGIRGLSSPRGGLFAPLAQRIRQRHNIPVIARSLQVHFGAQLADLLRDLLLDVIDYHVAILAERLADGLDHEPVRLRLAEEALTRPASSIGRGETGRSKVINILSLPGIFPK